MSFYLVFCRVLFYLRRSKENMDTLSYKTKHDNIKAEDKAWFVVVFQSDWVDVNTNRYQYCVASTRRATVLTSTTEKCYFINAEKVALTGKKWSQKKYF